MTVTYYLWVQLYNIQNQKLFGTSFKKIIHIKSICNAHLTGENYRSKSIFHKQEYM